MQIIQNEKESALVALETVQKTRDGGHEVIGKRGQVAILEIQLQRNPEQAHFTDVVSEKLLDLLMPRFIHAFLQKAVEGPSQHFLQVLDAAQKDMASCDLVLMLGKVAHERGQGTLANAPFAADKSDSEFALRAGFHHAAQAFDLTDAPDKKLNRHGLSRSERTRFRIHLAQSFIGTAATKS